MQARFNAAAMAGDLAHHAGFDDAPVRAVLAVESGHGRHLPAVQAAQLRIVHVVGLEAQRVRGDRSRQAQALALVQVHAQRAGAGEEALALPGNGRYDQRLDVIVGVRTRGRPRADTGLHARVLLGGVRCQRQADGGGEQQRTQQVRGQRRHRSTTLRGMAAHGEGSTLSEHCACAIGSPKGKKPTAGTMICTVSATEPLMRILLVEDDPDLSRALQSGLERQGVVADVVGSLAEAAIALREPVHQLMLLDRQLPDGDGAGFVATARSLRPNLAVIMLTAKGTLSDKVEGLDVGADDYLVKPVAIEELMARIRAVSRRPSAMVTPSLRLGRLEFDFESLQAQVEGQPLALPRRQVLVLQALAMRQGRTVTRSALEAAVYGFDDEIQSNALDAHISKLRKALQQAGAGVEIHVIRGVGYLLAEG
ncbi:Response regulator mprA [Stenotrophomonas maltophilia RA8]|nr:Response regulator mprA [Stenotrophomonas maltophilia RA8]